MVGGVIYIIEIECYYCRTNFMGYSPPKEGGLWYYLNEKKAGKGVSFG